MTQVVGYKLRNIATGEIAQSWGGVWGQCPPVPNPLVVPQPDDENGPQPPLYVCAATTGVDYGGYMVDEWVMDEADAPPPASVSDRQFFQQAAISGFITEAEALAAVQTGTIPAAMQAVIDTLPTDNSKFAAKMLVGGATIFERNHPLVGAVAASLGLTDAQVDGFFKAAALL